MFSSRLNTYSKLISLFSRKTLKVLRAKRVISSQFPSFSCDRICNHADLTKIPPPITNKFSNGKSYVMFSSDSSTEEVDAVTYEHLCEETLDSLCEFFEELVESSPVLKTADVSFGDGVLTINLDKFGTYVINRQSPNKQIWLSSPTSGPKRYDYVPSRNGWVYRHDNNTLHRLLTEEISAIVKTPIDLSNCAYCGVLK